MTFVRTLASGLGAIGGFVAWYAGMRITGLWSSFMVALYNDNRGGGALRRFAISFFLCGAAGGGLMPILGEKLRLWPSPEELDRQARPVSLFSRGDEEAGR